MLIDASRQPLACVRSLIIRDLARYVAAQVIAGSARLGAGSQIADVAAVEPQRRLQLCDGDRARAGDVDVMVDAELEWLAPPLINEEGGCVPLG